MARRRIATVAVVGGVAHHAGKKSGEAQAQQAAEAEAAAQQQYAPPAAPAELDYTAELQQLAQLHQQGILTDAEFEAKKSQILGI